MKKLFALSSLVLFGILLYSCEKQPVKELLSTQNETNFAGNDRSSCCAEDWSNENHSVTTYLLGGAPQNLYVDVWNDEVNIYYHVYRNPAENMGVVRHAVGAPCTSPKLNGTPTCESTTTCDFSIPIGDPNWASCDSRTVTIRVNGMGGGDPDYQDCTTYALTSKAPVANAGSDQTLCNTSSFTMAAVPSVGTGTWAFVGDPGTAVITTPTSPTTTVTTVPTNTNITLLWTENNHGCTGTDEVVIRNETCQQICYGGNETAWSSGPRYIDANQWATYTPYNGIANTVILYAGQTFEAGTATFSAPVEGMVTITIALNAVFAFQNVNENVKIQGYEVPPSGNPQPGQFSNKGKATGSPYSMTVPVANFYGVHLDVRHIIPCPE